MFRALRASQHDLTFKRHYISVGINIIIINGTLKYYVDIMIQNVKFLIQ